LRAVVRKSRSPAAPVTWRDGVHLTGTPIWCDARRRRGVCFVSSAENGGAEHGQLIATPQTLALIGASDGQLGVPLHKPFTLGTLRLELIPSGRGFGAAALHVDMGGHSVLYAGAIRGADVRAADAVVVASPLAEPGAPPPDAAAKLAAWVREQKSAVVGVASVLDGVTVATALAEAGLVVAGTKSLRDAAARAELPAIAAKGDVLIKVEGDRTRLPAGHAAWHVDARTWPLVASDRELLAWIEHTRAGQVFVTGAGAERIASAIGPRARVLGPPRQMSLFR
jgi:hypothetical protein